MYNIYLKPEVSTNFRNTINEYINFSIKHVYIKDKKSTNAWNTLCCIMDRIDDLVVYLNQKKLNTGEWKGCAFDFFEFIEQAGVLISCIDDAFEIYSFQFPKHNVIFKSKKINKKIKNNKTDYELDDNYFQYIRSLSSVHPSDTSRHKIFQEADFEVSPYVVWGGILFSKENSRMDLHIVSYNNESDYFLINKGIIISEIFNYIKYKYYSLNYLSKKVKKYYESIISRYRNEKLKKESDFPRYVNYLNYLKEESIKRGFDIECEINDAKNSFYRKITNSKNKRNYKKYENALKFAIKYVRRQLQNMDSSCMSPYDRLLDDLLYGKIYIDDASYCYPLEKIAYLKEDKKNMIFELEQYIKLLSIFQNYIDICENDIFILSFQELYYLSRIALYLHALEYNCVISYCIPNTCIYR